MSGLTSLTFVFLCWPFSCPGSVMFFFEFDNKRILHVGDFRFHSNMLRNKIGETPINELFLDTTYCDPKYTFPPQNDVIDFVVKTARRFLEENKRTLIVCGAYTIGKERVFHSLANELGLKIGVTKEKMKILKCLEDKDLENKLTLDYNLAQLHVLPLFSINLKVLLLLHKFLFILIAIYLIAYFELN